MEVQSRDYGDWSDAALERTDNRPQAENYRALVAAADGAMTFQEQEAGKLAMAWTDYLHDAKKAGYSDCTPGRFILPGDIMRGAPILTFAPLPRGNYPKGSLAAEFARRYDAYKKTVVTPFFKDHFAKIDRQVVLIDVLGAIHAGPRAVKDLRHTMQSILDAFQPMKNLFLKKIMGPRIDRILFAATKADHLHHTQHGKMTAIMQALVKDAIQRAGFSGAETDNIAMAALRTTTEETREHKGQPLHMVCGTLLNTGKHACFHPGTLPDNPGEILYPALKGMDKWLERDFQAMRFAPARLSLKTDEGPPHIRLDRAAQFLLGDKLQ